MSRSVTFRLFFFLSLRFRSAKTLSTTQSQIQGNVGWDAGPDRRGTLGLVWSCIATVILCTWTVLHLNVPVSFDSKWTRTFRKVKWMLITILFPEFVCAHAVEELRMAVVDLYALHEKVASLGTSYSWRVKITTTSRNLYKIFAYSQYSTSAVSSYAGKSPTTGARESNGPQSEGKPAHDIQRISPLVLATSPSGVLSSQPVNSSISDPERGERQDGPIDEYHTWTLTHSYLANMGGLQDVWPPKTTYSWQCATSRVLLKLIGSPRDPLQSLKLSEDDIKDKNKADWASTIIAMSQITWLVVSLIARACRGLPTSQLEIATVAFAAFAIATYAAEWHKPKDIGEAIRIELSGLDYDDLRREHWTSFFTLLRNPIRGGVGIRVGNDNISSVPFFSSLMALSSILFGGLHCLAWSNDFPSTAELWLWRTASISSATIPSVVLVLSGLITKVARRGESEVFSLIKDSCDEFINVQVIWWLPYGNRTYLDEVFPHPEGSGGLTRESYFSCPVCGSKTQSCWEWATRRDEFSSFSSGLRGLQKDLVSPSERNFGATQVQSHFSSWHDPTYRYGRGSKLLEDWRYFEQTVSQRYQIERHEYLTAGAIEYLRPRMNDIIALHKLQWENPWERVSKWLIRVLFTLYALARLSLIVLCFTTLRSQPVAIYETTWEHFWPSIS